MADRLSIETFTLGDWMTNCYVVSSGEGGCWLVDAGFEPGEMLDFVAEKKLQLRQVVLTHAHLDHIAGLSEVRDRYPQVPIVVHEAERAFLVEPALNLSIMLGEPVIAPQATGTLAHGQVLQLDDLSFEVRHTPGHSPGGICLYNAEHATAITGDTLFAGSVGRHDFPTADGWALMKSIREQLLTLPDETKVLPGHGPATTIGRERRSNPFLR